MTRDRMIALAREEVLRRAPGVAVSVAEDLLLRWFDSIARRRPRGIVAAFRRLRWRHRGLSNSERKELAEMIRAELAKRIPAPPGA